MAYTRPGGLGMGPHRGGYCPSQGFKTVAGYQPKAIARTMFVNEDFLSSLCF